MVITTAQLNPVASTVPVEDASASSFLTGTLKDFLGFNGSFDWREFMIRTSEVIVGILLTVVAVNAGLKQSVQGNPVVKSAKRVGKKVLG
jgi:hypothetical protein